MKIGVVSDLHTDASKANKDLIPFLITAIKKANIDILVLAGDITANLSEFFDIFDQFNKAKLQCRKLFVPGNHDIWVKKNGRINSKQKCGILSEICHENGFHPLIDSPYIEDNIGFCGTIGWYDYSFASDDYNITIEQYEKKQYKGRIWNDKRFVNWEDTDKVIARNFENKLSYHIKSIADIVERIIVVSHHVPFRECIHYTGDLANDYFHAFMGSVGIGEICLQQPLISHVLFGHLHENVDQQMNDISLICSPVGYLSELQQDELQTYAEQCLTSICLDE